MPVPDLKDLCRSYQTSGGVKSEWWWCYDDSLRLIAKELLLHNSVVIDSFLPEEDANLFLCDVNKAYSDGLLTHDGVIAGGKLGLDESFVDKSIRGDLFGYFDNNDQDKWPTGGQLKTLLDKMNTIVCELRDLKLSSNDTLPMLPELKNVKSRSKGMVTCYPGNGTKYSKHIDNAIGNGRKITAIYYPNKNDWNSEKDGGNLVIHPSLITQSNNTDTKKPCIIEPRFNRLILFWSDSRCPHEVEPCYSNRFAVTVWFIDSVEKAGAKLATSSSISKTESLPLSSSSSQQVGEIPTQKSYPKGTDTQNILDSLLVDITVTGST